jgi:hypothetical protein
LSPKPSKNCEKTPQNAQWIISEMIRLAFHLFLATMCGTGTMQRGNAHRCAKPGRVASARRFLLADTR